MNTPLVANLTFEGREVVALSCLFYFTPYLNKVSAGIAYIICAVVASVIGAIFFPIKDDDNTEKEAENG